MCRYVIWGFCLESTHLSLCCYTSWWGRYSWCTQGQSLAIFLIGQNFTERCLTAWNPAEGSVPFSFLPALLPADFPGLAPLPPPLAIGCSLDPMCPSPENTEIYDVMLQWPHAALSTWFVIAWIDLIHCHLKTNTEIHDEMLQWPQAALSTRPDTSVANNQHRNPWWNVMLKHQSSKFNVSMLLMDLYSWCLPPPGTPDQAVWETKYTRLFSLFHLNSKHVPPLPIEE